MGEWREVKLGDVSDITSSKRIFYSDYVTRGVPFWRSKEVIEKYHGKAISTDLFISQEKYQEIKDMYGVPQVNDILLTSVGTLGVPHLVQTDKPFYFKDGNLTWIRNIDKKKLNPKYLYIWLASKLGKDALREITIGSTQEALTIAGLKTLSLLLPPPPEQSAITSVLSSLDDKIDLLHRQNQTLEGLAETLFRHWFVEKAQEDWEVIPLDRIITVKGGTTPSTKEAEYWDGNIPWTTPRDLSNHESVFLFDTERKITEAGLAQIGSGLLPIGTVLLSSRAPIGYLAIAEIPLAVNQGYIAILCDKAVSNYFMYLWCKANMEDIKNAGNGSVFQEISKSNFKMLPMTRPPASILRAFDEVLHPVFAKIKENQKQMALLRELRDSLLPKLMTGKVRIGQ